ncbi:DUF6493 family protein [Nonomuraea sp. NPDC050783]|uniref:DUF7825 domain-containing protein n=1 Tax=Nonomuraea sp. NPDC050783 TaxID=3154634 RepID=UPI0034665CCB
MNPWLEALDRIEAGDDEDLVSFLDGLSDLGRRAVAVRLPGHLAEELRGGFTARQEIAELATGFRLAGAACFTGAEQVAAWLDRRELRAPRDPERDAGHIVALLRRRSVEWRRDLAVRLAGRLRPPTGRRRSGWWRMEGVPGWDLVAALVSESGLEPPDSDAFVLGWVWRLALRRRWGGPGLGGDLLLGSGLGGEPSLGSGLGGGPLRDPDLGGEPLRDPDLGGGASRDPLLRTLLPRLFRTPGVAEPLALIGHAGTTILDELAVLAREGRVPRRMLIDGCASRFLTGEPGESVVPFVMFWRSLRPEPAEIPVLDFVRLLPAADPSLAQLALDELRRAEDAGLLSDELFAEAVVALAYRPEKKLLRAAVQWLARTPGPRSGGAVPALAVVFGVDTPALRERAVRLAVRLAPYADEAGREAVREAAARLPAELRERLAAGYGPVAGEEPERPVAVLRAPAPPALAPPFGSAAELVAELRALSWDAEPLRCERAFGGLVALTHRDRDGMVAALRSWWEESRPDGPGEYVFDRNLYHPGVPDLLARCALAVLAPERSLELGRRTGVYCDTSYEWPVQGLLRRRLEEVTALFERGQSVPSLLATPTSATGHVAAEALVERMELLGEREPLEADFQQALLRLPRHTPPELLVRAEKLPSRAGRTLAAWLRDGGLPDPVVRLEPREEKPDGYHSTDWYRRVRAEVVPLEGLPGWLAELWVVDERLPYPYERRDMSWWPVIMPSHREVVAAWLARVQPWLAGANDTRMEALATLAHGDGPVGDAVAFVVAAGLGHRRDGQRAVAVEAALTLAARGQLPAAGLGQAVVELVRHEWVGLRRVTAAFAELVAGGAHAAVWKTLAVALPPLLPRPGERPRAGLGELLGVAAEAATGVATGVAAFSDAAEAATRGAAFVGGVGTAAGAAFAGARGEIAGLAELAARKGSSLLLHEARRLHKVLTAPAE